MIVARKRLTSTIDAAIAITPRAIVHVKRLTISFVCQKVCDHRITTPARTDEWTPIPRLTQ